MDEEKRNTIIFFVLSLLVIIGYPYFFDNNTTQNKQPIQQVEKTVTVDNNRPTDHQIASNIPEKSNHKKSVSHAKLETIEIQSLKLSGTISSQGVRINNVLLNTYKNEIDKPEKVAIFGKDQNKYFATSGWVSDDKTIALPDENTCWEVGDNKVLTEKTPVTMTWDNQQGLLFEKKISVDENYVISIEDKVRNYGDKNYELKYVTDVHREFSTKADSSSIAYEGPIGYLNDKSEEIKYEDIAKKGSIKHTTQGGWFGLTDKYWLVAFIPDQKTMSNVSYNGSADGKIFDVISEGDTVSIAGYSEATKVNHLYVGAKEINTLDMYETKLGIKHFDLAIDFGWMYILTKPFLYVLAYAKDLVGNMGLGIILITLLLKLLLFPLSNKSYRSMNKMKEIQPKLKALQEKYANDKMKLSQEMSALYRKDKISPMSGCLPMLLQWPILFALYKVLYVSIEMRQAPFFGWIQDLSQPDTMYILNLFGLIPISLPGFLEIGIWPLLMGLTMLWQQKMSPAPADPAQEKMMLIMPIMFTFMFAQMPSGLVIYWTFSNVLNIVQQSVLMKIDAKEKAQQIAMKKNKSGKNNEQSKQ